MSTVQSILGDQFDIRIIIAVAVLAAAYVIQERLKLRDDIKKGKR